MPLASLLWKTCEMRSRSSATEVSFSINEARITVPLRPRPFRSASSMNSGPIASRNRSTSVSTIRSGRTPREK
jgi:hypothetical protein